MGTPKRMDYSGKSHMEKKHEEHVPGESHLCSKACWPRSLQKLPG
jgi:hypothetical protein